MARNQSLRQVTAEVRMSPRQLIRLVTVEAEKKMTLLGPCAGPLGGPGSPNSPSGHKRWGPGSHPCLIASKSLGLLRYGLGDR